MWVVYGGTLQDILFSYFCSPTFLIEAEFTFVLCFLGSADATVVQLTTVAISRVVCTGPYPTV